MKTKKGSVEPKPAVAEASHKEDYSSGVTKSVGPSSFTDERLMAKLDNALREVLIFDATHANYSTLIYFNGLSKTQYIITRSSRMLTISETAKYLVKTCHFPPQRMARH